MPAEGRQGSLPAVLRTQLAGKNGNTSSADAEILSGAVFADFRHKVNPISVSVMDGGMPEPDPRAYPTGEFPRTAIPVFRDRVSPVLDTCTRVRLLDPGRMREIHCITIPLKGTSIFERAEEIKKLGVGVIICGAVSDTFYNLLKERYIDMVCGITGDIDEVALAYRDGMLADARFRMPGTNPP